VKRTSPKPSKAPSHPSPAPNPLAPRLRPSGAPLERQALERELKKTKARLLDLEKRVTESEQAVKALEVQMAAPGFYDDRARAAQAAEEHQKLMWETGDLMAQWEALQAEVDEKSQQLGAVAPGPRR
jgi:chromosome segregation ATPase